MPNPFTPSPLVEVAFGIGPYASPAPGDWVDITDYVDEVTISRGRDSEMDTFGASTASLLLDNTDRRFDPLNTAGPYYGDLVANAHIRIRADIATVKYDIWRGYVDGWPAEYREGGFDRTVELECSDAFKLLGERSAHDTQTEDILGLPGVTIVRRWYRFDEVRDGDSMIADAQGNGTTDLRAWGQWGSQEKISAAAARGALGHEQHAAPENTENVYRAASRLIGPYTNAPVQNDRWAVALVVRVTDVGQMGGYSLPLVWIGKDRPDGGFVNVLDLSLHHGGTHFPGAPTCPGCVAVSFATGGPALFANTGPGGTNALAGGSGINVPGTFNPFDGLAHSIVLVRQTTQLELWCDGVLVATGSNGASTGVPTWDTEYDLRVYWPFQGIPAAVGRVFPGVILQNMLFLDALNPATFNPVDVHNALMVGMAQEVPSGTALDAALARAGWNPLLLATDAGETLVRAPANPYGMTWLELLQRYADSEGGRLFVDASGRIAFHAADRFRTNVVETTVQYTFSDTDPSSVSVDGTLRVTVDDSFVFEAAEVEREGGIPQRAESTATPSRSYTLDGLLFLNDHQSRQRAERIVFLYSTPRPRTDAFGVWPEVDAADWPAILGLELGTRIRLIVTPGGSGSQIDLQQHLELIEHVITPTDWSIVMNGTPVDDTVYFEWGGSSSEGWGNGVWR